ncbi:uncharacterized protein LOC120357220 [Solenopsis invicta]|uniref:uncharacterized protein LOC120357220 n=1 Tax=Solenopsis invicta TaxID=13686 RepID=UPI00193D23A3|nr:uncharacterized protein LOC120357220 [Solenopsis invicta]
MRSPLRDDANKSDVEDNNISDDNLMTSNVPCDDKEALSNNNTIQNNQVYEDDLSNIQEWNWNDVGYINDFDDEAVENITHTGTSEPEYHDPNLNDTLCSCTTTTRGETILICMRMAMRFCLPWNAVVCMLQAINIILKKKTFCLIVNINYYSTSLRNHIILSIMFIIRIARSMRMNDHVWKILFASAEFTLKFQKQNLFFWN